MASHTLSANRQLHERVMTMARYLARNRVKDELRARGLRLDHFPCDIQRMAQAYLACRGAELIEEAKAILHHSTLSEFC
jgi:hypothetical protein